MKRNKTYLHPPLLSPPSILCLPTLLFIFSSPSLFSPLAFSTLRTLLPSTFSSPFYFSFLLSLSLLSKKVLISAFLFQNFLLLFLRVAFFPSSSFSSGGINNRGILLLLLLLRRGEIDRGFPLRKVARENGHLRSVSQEEGSPAKLGL